MNFNLNCTDYENQLRMKDKIEGYVIHYLKDGKTIRMQKHKTYWYIVLRVLRTIILSRRNSSKEEIKKLFIQRLAQRNRDFLKLNTELFEYWENFGIQFLNWLPVDYITTGVLDPMEGRGMADVLKEWKGT